MNSFLDNFANRSSVFSGITFGGALLLSARFWAPNVDKRTSLVVVIAVIAKNSFSLSCYENGFISDRKGYVITQLIGAGTITAIACSVLQVNIDRLVICTVPTAISEMALTLLSTRSEAHLGSDAIHKREWGATPFLGSSLLLAAVAPIAYGRYKAGSSFLKDPVLYAASIIAALFVISLTRYIYIPSKQILADFYEFGTISAENAFKMGLFLALQLIECVFKLCELENIQPEVVLFALAKFFYKKEKDAYLFLSKIEKIKSPHIDELEKYFIFNGVEYPDVESMAAAADRYKEAHIPRVSSQKESIEVINENLKELSALANLLNSPLLKTAVTNFKKRPSLATVNGLISARVRAALHPDLLGHDPALQMRCQNMLATLNSISV